MNKTIIYNPYNFNMNNCYYQIKYNFYGITDSKRLYTLDNGFKRNLCRYGLLYGTNGAIIYSETINRIHEIVSDLINRSSVERDYVSDTNGSVYIATLKGDRVLDVLVSPQFKWLQEENSNFLITTHGYKLCDFAYNTIATAVHAYIRKNIYKWNISSTSNVSGKLRSFINLLLPYCKDYNILILAQYINSFLYLLNLKNIDPTYINNVHITKEFFYSLSTVNNIERVIYGINNESKYLTGIDDLQNRVAEAANNYLEKNVFNCDPNKYVERVSNLTKVIQLLNENYENYKQIVKLVGDMT